MSQQLNGKTPVYRVLDEQGPEHARSFKIRVEIGDQHFSPAWGPSKKKAEELAAQNAIDQLEGRSPRYAAD
jgi:ribonuclease-3